MKITHVRLPRVALKPAQRSHGAGFPTPQVTRDPRTLGSSYFCQRHVLLEAPGRRVTSTGLESRAIISASSTFSTDDRGAIAFDTSSRCP